MLHLRYAAHALRCTCAVLRLRSDCATIALRFSSLAMGYGCAFVLVLAIALRLR
jgi:hypothetical protein